MMQLESVNAVSNCLYQIVQVSTIQEKSSNDFFPVASCTPSPT